MKKYRLISFIAIIVLLITLSACDEVHEHIYGDGVVLREATCATPGEMLYACTECGDTYSEEISILAEHTYDSGVVTKAATCKDKGIKTFTCTICGKTRTEDVPLLTEHTYDNGVVTKAATCKDKGVKTFTCTICGKTRTEDVSLLTTHTYDSGVVTKEATCKEKGVKTFTCTVCGKTRTEDVPLLTVHTYNDGVVTKEPTCKEKGVKTFTCTICGKTRTEDVPLLTEHTYDSGVVTKAATCKEKGVKTYTCTVCGDTYTEDIALLTTHTYNSGVVTKAATCKEKGVKTFTCTICEKTITEDIPLLTVHTYNDGVVTKEPTYTEDGARLYTCTVCSMTKTEVLEKLPILCTITMEGIGEYYVGISGEYSLTAPVKSGYRFMKWTTKDGEDFAPAGTIAENVSIVAVFEKLTEQGLTFSSNDRKYMTEPLTALPVTVGFKIKLAEDVEAGSVYGTLLSNSIRWSSHISYDINQNRNPVLNLGNLRGDPEGLLYNSPKDYIFTKVKVPVGELVDLWFVIDVANLKLKCYLNGALAQTITVDASYLKDACYSQNPFVVGGNTTGSNYNHFKGEIYELSMWSDTRTAKEIANKAYGSSKAEDSALMVRYQFYNNVPSELLLDLSGNGYDISVDRLWLDKSEVEPAEGDYCFAVVGDTQSLIYKHPEEMSDLYDWLVANAESLNIRYVMGLGDITENALIDEWDYARANIYKLSGVVPFSVVIGNHDKYDYKNQDYVPPNRTDFLFNQYFYDDTYLAELDGWYGDGDVTCAYNAFEAGNTKWLLLTLDFGPTDEMLEWASAVIAAHPDHKVIITTHVYLYRDGTTVDREDCYASSRYNPTFNDGDQIFEKLISKHENIVLVISGHDPHDHVVCSQVKGDNGNTITQLLIDPQYMDYFYGATGMVALLYYSEENNTMTIRYYSTSQDMYGSERSQFTVSLS